MSYQKHNFTPGAVLLASQLNDIDNQIEVLSNQESILPENFKTALLNCFENVAWINENGQTYYDALYDSLYPDNMWFITNILTGCATSNNATSILKNNSYVATITASEGYSLDGATVSITMGGNDVTNLYYSSGSINIPNVTGDLVITVLASSAVTSISAVFTQGSATIYDTDTLDSLKADLVVTAVYSDSSTQTVPAADYTLSGTLTDGTSTITVSYGGKTTTFSVTVTAYWTWEYNPAEDGLLSAQSYVQMGSNTGETEEISSGLLHIVVPQNNTQQNSFQARLSDGLGTFNVSTGEIVCKVKFSGLSVPSTAGSGFRLQISQGGTRSAKFYASKINNAYTLRLTSAGGSGGTQYTTDLMTLTLNTWYVIGIKVYENNFVITVNGAEVYNGSEWSTQVSTYCGLYAISDKLSGGENTNLNIEYMKFRSGGVS